MSDSVRLTLTHNILNIRIPEIRYDCHMTIESFKQVCHQKTGKIRISGTQEDSMKLVLQDQNGNTIGPMDDDAKKLGYYSPMDDYIVHVKRSIRSLI